MYDLVDIKLSDINIELFDKVEINKSCLLVEVAINDTMVTIFDNLEIGIETGIQNVIGFKQLNEIVRIRDLINRKQ